MALAVNQRSASIERIAKHWPMLEALMGGTDAMRAAGETFLPKFPNEDPEAYKCRLATATLFPAFKRTARVLASKPFSRPLTFSDATPVEIKGREANPEASPPVMGIAGWADDIDLQGVNLHTFAGEMALEALSYGLCGILVEAPKPIQGAGAVVTQADQKRAGVRPYFVRVMHGQILGGRLRRVGNQMVLTQLRLRETDEVDDGDWGDKTVERVRVLEPGQWTIHEQEGGLDGKWSITDGGTTTLQEIPFVPIYGSRLAYLMGISPLLELAHLNVKQWQSQSDQDNILHVARVPILFAKGFQDDDTITVGANTAVQTTSTDADMKFVEHTGAAIEAGQTSLDDLKEEMVQAGAEIVEKREGGERTATETATDGEANKSDLQRFAEGLEDSLDRALDFMAKLGGLAPTCNVTLFKEFGGVFQGTPGATVVFTAQDRGLLSKPSAINELKRRGELAPEIDAKRELALVESEGPALGTITDDPDA